MPAPKRRTPAADPDPGRRAADRLRPLPGQAHASATASRSRRRSSATATRCSARALRYRAGGRARSWREAPMGAFGQRPLDGPASRSTPSAAGSSRSRRGSTASPPGAGAPAQGRGRPGATSRASSPRARSCYGVEALTRQGGARRRRATTATSVTSLRRRSSSTSTASSRASAPGTSSSRARGAASRASRRCCRSWPSSASTSSTCRRSTRSARTNRKGRNNMLDGEAGRSGQPVGDRRRGGRPRRDPPRPRHDRRLRPPRRRARSELGVEICLDFAIQCSPDHPWLKEHPEWFNRRPDGTLKYAENPPKKYQDIYNVNFDSEDWQGLWEALRDVVRVLGRPRRAGLPRRQPAHEAGAVLGVADRRDPRGRTRT